VTVAAVAAVVAACLVGPARAAPGGGMPSVPDPAGFPTGLQHLVQDVVDAGAPGATMLLRDGDQTRTYSAGVSDLDTERVLGPEDRFRVGSITKTFMATLVLQLVAAGDVELDAPVATYLPRLLPDGEHITVRHLLQHTSGLYEYTLDPDFLTLLLSQHRFSPREIVSLSTRHDVLFPPGEEWSYSNTNYIVLGLLLRKAGGANVKAQLKERIIEPLGLSDTRLYVHNPEVNGPHAHGYLGEAGGRLSDVTTAFEPSWAWTAGALVSNGTDLAVFYRALLDAALFPSGLLDEMKDTVPAGEIVGYGLGLFSAELPCGTAWGHDGLYIGYLVMALSSEDGEHQLVLSMNVDPINGVPPPEAFEAFTAAYVGGFCGGSGGSALPVPLLDSPVLGPAPLGSSARATG
jgi:D-alanyl-D-alanine carboxypeptidase